MEPENERDLEDVLRRGYQVANSTLAQQGDFSAFGVGRVHSGEYRTVFADDGSREAIRDELRRGLESNRFDLTAFFEMATVEEQDVTAVFLDCVDWQKLILVPYEFVDGELVHGEPTVTKNPDPLVVKYRN